LYESSDDSCLSAILNNDQSESNFVTAATIFGVFQPEDAGDNFIQTGQPILRTTKMWPDTIVFPWNDSAEHTDFKDADSCWWCEGYEYVNHQPRVGPRISPNTTLKTSENWDGRVKNVEWAPLLCAATEKHHKALQYSNLCAFGAEILKDMQ
jgi:hypothetical protein